MGKSYIPSKDQDLKAWSLNFATLISASPTTYSLTAALATAYQTLQTSYTTALAASTNPSTRGKATVITKKTARRLLVAQTRVLARTIYGVSTLTPTQISDLGLTVRDTDPTPIGPPTATPEASIFSTRGRVLKIKTHDPAEPTKLGLPTGVRGVAAFIAKGATPPTDWTGWSLLGISTRSIFEVEIDDNIPAGTLVWITCYYVNPRNQAGTACTPFSTYAAAALEVAA